ncbi:MAG: DUF3108 domain-containing protein [Deltaproteobacteria bacterium]|nr:MAG: DUF3108 domain-containing protein [Deltaproteobacteria bacterium]
MKNSSIIFLTFSLISISLFSGCASKKGNFTDQVSPDLVETFDLEDSKFDKFKVVEEESLKKEEEKKEPEKVTEVPKKKIIEKKSEKKTAKKKTTPVPEKKKEETPKPEKKVVKIVDNSEEEVEEESEYPENFVKYDKASRKIWDKFKPNAYPGEEFVIKISYLGVTAGHIKVRVRNKVKVAGKTAYHFSAHLKSAEYYSMIYKLDDKIETYVDINEFIPIKYSLIQRESGKDVDDLQLFDHNTKTTYFWYKRKKDGKTTKREMTTFIPNYFQDNFSALFFVRGLPLNPGDHYTFPLVTRGKILLMDMKYERSEIIEIMDKDVKAIRIEAQMLFPGLMQKKGRITFWYSADDVRRILKFEAKVKIGSIEGELVDYKAGQKIEL